MNDTKIEWADDTVNSWWGCQKVSAACTNCYAESLDARFKMGGETHWGVNAPRFLRVEKAIAELDRIAKRGDKEGRPRRVFLHSMSDFFEDREDLVEPRRRVWECLHHLAGVEHRVTPMLLTKRPEIMADWAKAHGWPQHAWAGATVENQEWADKRIPWLLQVPAPVRFLSCEPLLGPVDLTNTSECDCMVPCWEGAGMHSPKCAVFRIPRGIGWVIAGGESGPHARPMHPDWARSLRDQCESAGVAYHFKQWGQWVECSFDEPGAIGLDTKGTQYWAPNDHPEWTWMHKFTSKHAAGRLLDGREWNEVPHV